MALVLCSMPSPNTAKTRARWQTLELAFHHSLKPSRCVGERRASAQRGTSATANPFFRRQGRLLSPEFFMKSSKTIMKSWRKLLTPLGEPT